MCEFYSSRQAEICVVNENTFHMSNNLDFMFYIYVFYCLIR